MEWRTIETCPNDDSIVLWHIPGSRMPVVCRADDYWAGRSSARKPGFAYWLDEATHWMAYEPPKQNGE